MKPDFTKDNKALMQVKDNLLKQVIETNKRITPNYVYMRTTKEDEWQSQSPCNNAQPNSIGSIGEGTQSVEGTKGKECYICHGRNLKGTRLACPNCGNNREKKYLYVEEKKQ